MYKVKAQYLGVQLVSTNGTIVLSDSLTQQELKWLAEEKGTASFIEQKAVKEVVEKPKAVKKDEEVKEGTAAAGADQKGV